ncbi:MAG: hypothetical protein HW419_2729 [Deltaproteobacteria bacterium]|nr:hypothetical protein [Deltaproteobacteria bacterium]
MAALVKMIGINDWLHNITFICQRLIIAKTGGGGK